MIGIELKKIHEIPLGAEHELITVGISSPSRFILIYANGVVGSYDVGAEKVDYLLSLVQEHIGYHDGGFDLKSSISIYTMDDIVVVVNDYKLHGCIYYKGKTKVHLWRKDHHAAISQFPIALFKDENEVPHIIYGQDGNRIHIMNLDTLQVLTADKSLIEENAEQNHLDHYAKSSESNRFPWPREYDYFFGALEMSPGNKSFLSKGWVWGSVDACHIFEVEHFIKSNRIRDLGIGFGEHENRAICWIDEHTIAATYNAFTDGDSQEKTASTEVVLYNISAKEATEVRKFTMDVFDGLSGEMYFSKELNALVILTKGNGLTVCDIEGNIQFRDKSFQADSFHKDTNTFIGLSGSTVSVHQLSIG